ncbi:phosphopentomutase, partial [Enterococcus faecium]
KMKEQGALPQGYNSEFSATIAENFSVSSTENGESFLKILK